MLHRALVLPLLVLAGCYVSARGGPAYSFDGERRGTTFEVVVGAEIHLSPQSPSPVDRRFAIFNSLGMTRAPAAGAHRAGFVYEIGGAALLQLERHPSVADGPGSATLVRADLSGTFGKLLGLEGDNGGAMLGARGLVEVERYWEGWAVRGGAGVQAATVQIEDDTPGPQEFEGSYAPIGSVTFEFTPIITRAIRRVFIR